MSSSEDNDLVPGGATSPYDEQTDALDRDAIERGVAAARPKARRPRPDRDDFFAQHGGGGRRPAPAPREAEAAPTTPIDTAADDGLPPVSPDSGAEESSATTRLPRSDVPVRSTHDEGVTEPFDDLDEQRDRPRGERRTAEHLTQDPLPYIEPQPTRPIVEEPVFESEPFEPEPEPVAVATVPPEPVRERRGTIDLGLLVLRVVVGAAFILHGLQKLTGWMNGPGLDGFAQFLENASDPSRGFNPDATRVLAIVGAVTETGAGVLLVLGLLTPIAGSALLGTILIAGTFSATLSGGLWYFAQDGNNSGVEYQILLAAACAALILTGPGTYSIDRRWGWARRPAWGSAVWLLIGIGSAIAVWVVFNGANPLVNH